MSSLFEKNAKQSLQEVELRKKNTQKLSKQPTDRSSSLPKEINGPKGLEPTRYVTGKKKVLLPIFNLFV